MATIKRFEDLEIWQEAREHYREIVAIANTTGLKSDFKLKDQIKAALGSVMDNIAEGFERDGNLEFRQFLSIAKGSQGEARSQLYRIYDSGYIEKDTMTKMSESYENLSKRIARFIQYLNKKDFKGTKFKENSNPKLKLET